MKKHPILTPHDLDLDSKKCKTKTIKNGNFFIIFIIGLNMVKCDVGTLNVSAFEYYYERR